MPPNTVKVDRTTRWGNPYKLTDFHPMMSEIEKRSRCIAAFRGLLLGEITHALHTLPFTAEDVRRELKGKNLACWCPPHRQCHADVLLAVCSGAMRERAQKGEP
jgi:hypothetical protein